MLFVLRFNTIDFAANSEYNDITLYSELALNYMPNNKSATKITRFLKHFIIFDKKDKR